MTFSGMLRITKTNQIVGRVEGRNPAYGANNWNFWFSHDGKIWIGWERFFP